MADKLDGKLQAHLGGRLRDAYQPTVAETLPNRLCHLLEALDRRQSEVKTATGSEHAADGGPTPTVDSTAREKMGRIKKWAMIFAGYGIGWWLARLRAKFRQTGAN
jgi:hypothetical protein